MVPRYRQEVLNVILAQLLQERGVATLPESIAHEDTLHTRRIPDVLVRFRGLRLAIEGEISGTEQAELKAIKSAYSRVEEGIAHIGVAIVYPEVLRTTDFRELKKQLADVALEIVILTEAGKVGPITGRVNQLESALRHTFEQLVEEDTVKEAVSLLSAAIERFAGALQRKRGIRDRLRRTLGVGELKSSDFE